MSALYGVQRIRFFGILYTYPTYLYAYGEKEQRDNQGREGEKRFFSTREVFAQDAYMLTAV